MTRMTSPSDADLAAALRVDLPEISSALSQEADNPPEDPLSDLRQGPWSNLLYERMPMLGKRGHFERLHSTMLGLSEVSRLLVRHGSAAESAANHGSELVHRFDSGNLACAFYVLDLQMHVLMEELEKPEFWKDTRDWLNKWDGK